jgi:hypothetical protein
MPFLLIIVGTFMVVSAARGTHQQLATLVKGDFSGPNNFVYWVLAILIVGSIGYVPKVKPFSVMFLALIIIVMFLRSGDPATGAGGFFDKFMQGIGATNSTPTTNASNSGSNGGQIIPLLPTLPTLPTF